MVIRHNKLVEIITVDNCCVAWGIRFYKRPGKSYFGVRVPFEFPGVNGTIFFFQIIDFLLLMRSPEIGSGPLPPIVYYLLPLAYQKVLPQRTYVGT